MRCRYCKATIWQTASGNWVHKTKIPPYGFNYYYYCFLEGQHEPRSMAAPEEPEDLPLENV